MPKGRAIIKARATVQRSTLHVRQMGTNRLHRVDGLPFALWNASNGKGKHVRNVPFSVDALPALPATVSGITERGSIVRSDVYVTFRAWKTLKKTGNGKERIRAILLALADMFKQDYDAMRSTANRDRLHPWQYRFVCRGVGALQRLEQFVNDNADLLALSARP